MDGLQETFIKYALIIERLFLELTFTDISAIAHIIKENRTILIPIIKHLRTLFPILKLCDVTRITAIITGISINCQ